MWNYKLEHSAQTEDQCNELVGGRQPLVLQGLDCHQKNVAHGADGLNRTEGADLESLVAYNDAQGVEDASDYSAPKQVETEVIFHPVDDRPDQLDDIDKQYGIEWQSQTVKTDTVLLHGEFPNGDAYGSDCQRL